MEKDDAGFLDFFEEKPIIDSGEDEVDVRLETPSVVEKEVKDKSTPIVEQLEDENASNETNETGEEKEAKRYAYWQAKHDKLQKEMEAIKSQAEINEDYAPIAEYLYQNPQALLKLQEQLAESAPSTSAPQMPVAPEKPKKPANYSKYEAVQDLESPSAKYDEALMSYNSDMLDYMNAKQLYNEKQQYAQMQAAAERERAARKQEAFKADLLANGLKADEYNDFIAKVNGPESISAKNLIAYYKMLSGSGVTKNQLQAEEFARQQARIKNSPAPIGSEGGESTATPSDDDLFNNDLLNWKKIR